MENTEPNEVSAAAFHLPSTWKRLLALLVDGIIISVPMALIYAWGGVRVTETEITFFWLPYIASLIFAFGLQIVCLIKWSRTPGKMLLGLYITDAKTQLPGVSVKQALLRVLSGLLCFPFSLAPQTYALFRTDRKQLLDLIAGTQVLQKTPRKSPPKVRWIIGGLLMLYFVVSGLWNTASSARTLHFSAEGMSMELPKKEAR